MAYLEKTFYTSSGPVTYHFDFIPAEPTTEQLGRLVPHTCETCEWKNQKRMPDCGIPRQATDSPCKFWEIGPAAWADATHEYYKRLYESTH